MAGSLAEFRISDATVFQKAQAYMHHMWLHTHEESCYMRSHAIWSKHETKQKGMRRLQVCRVVPCICPAFIAGFQACCKKFLTML